MQFCVELYYGTVLWTLHRLLRLCEGDWLQSDAPKTIPYRNSTHRRPRLLLILLVALFGPSCSLVQFVYRVCACEHDAFTYLLFSLINSENDVSMSQLLSICEPQSFSKFNNKCQRIKSILETNNLPCQKKRTNEKVVLPYARTLKVLESP